MDIEISYTEFEQVLQALNAKIVSLSDQVKVHELDKATYEEVIAKTFNEEFKAHSIENVNIKLKEINAVKRKQLEYERIITKLKDKKRFVLFKKEQRLLKDIRLTFDNTKKDMDFVLKSYPNLYKTIKKAAIDFTEKLNAIINEESNVYIVRNF